MINETEMPHTMKLRPRTPARKSGPGQYAAKCRQRAAVSTAKWSRRLIITTGIVLMILLLRATYYYVMADSLTITTSENEGEGSYSTGRKLQSINASNTSHTSHKAVAWEQCDFEKANSRYAFLVPYIFLIFSLFIGVAIICDDFFVPSLEAISEKLDLSEDVAGATFMAAGSSAPELFTSVAGVGVDSDVGIGTIVGSAMFNILIIIALSAVLSGQVLNLDWRPLARDSLIYGLSIVIFIGFAWDGKLEWYEALVLLLIYIMYIAIMKFNPQLLELLAKIECNWCRNESRIEPVISSVSSQSASVTVATQGEDNPTEGHRTTSHTHTHDGHENHRHRFVHSHRGELAGPITNRRRSVVTHDLPHHHSQGSHANEPHAHQLPTILSPIQSQPSESQEQAVAVASQGSHYSSATQEEEEDEVMALLPCLPPIKTSVPNLTEALQQGKMGIAKYICHWILFIMAFPYLVAYTWTIPNCSKNRKWYVVSASFTMAILWIAVISFGMVTLVARVGCILGIGEFTMGLVVVAVGTSIPDAISSILVARDGFGDMAVSNAIGSNVFDVNLGLGLPFLIRTAIDKGAAFSLLDDELQEKYDSGDMAIVPHAKFGFLLMFVLLATVGTLSAFRFRLNSFTGLCFVIIYALFLTYSFVQETICKRGQYC